MLVKGREKGSGGRGAGHFGKLILERDLDIKDGPLGLRGFLEIQVDIPFSRSDGARSRDLFVVGYL